MDKIKTLKDLETLRDQLKEKKQLMHKEGNEDSAILVKVGMGTSGIASGAKDVMDFLVEALKKRNIDAMVLQTGDMGYSYAEPTIEIQKPGNDPVIFGDVNVKKADDIIENYIRNDELVEGVIPVNYETIDE